MAGAEQFLLEGGMSSPALSLNASGVGMGNGQSGNPPPHYSVIALVLMAVAVLWALDKFGFRFAVTAGRH